MKFTSRSLAQLNAKFISGSFILLFTTILVAAIYLVYVELVVSALLTGLAAGGIYGTCAPFLWKRDWDLANAGLSFGLLLIVPAMLALLFHFEGDYQIQHLLFCVLSAATVWSVARRKWLAYLQ
ncbi:MAG: hypothetical protein ACFHVJ_07930 [Aestuariibacter sp.]